MATARYNCGLILMKKIKALLSLRKGIHAVIVRSETPILSLIRKLELNTLMVNEKNSSGLTCILEPTRLLLGIYFFRLVAFSFFSSFAGKRSDTIILQSCLGIINW